MGNCRSSPSALPGPGSAEPAKNDEVSTNIDDASMHTDDFLRDSTSALMNAFLPRVLSSMRELLSKRLIEQGHILLEEKPVTTYCKNSGDLPFKPVSVEIGSVRVVDPGTLRNDMDAMPDFEWPEKDQVEELMERLPEGGVGMVVLDLVDTDVKISFSRGVEVTLPAKGPMGTSGDLEFGAGGDIDEAWFLIKKVRLRLWIVNKTGQIYIAFMDGPDSVVPHFHVNFDKGRGDFMGKVYKESGSSFDDALFRVLSYFSPGKEGKEIRVKTKKSWKMDMMKGIWESASENLKPQGGKKVPLEVGMSYGTSSDKEVADADDTVALIESFLPIVLPIVRNVVSKNLIDQGLVLRDEKPVTDFADAQMNSGLPIRPICVRIGKLAVVSGKTLRNDMNSTPKFEWPEQERVEELMERKPEGSAGMIVLDLENVDVDLTFDEGVELVFPVEGPMGMKMDLEVGSGGSVKEAGFQLKNLKIRVWFVAETGKLYIAFMDRPDIVPHIHVNVDRGRGDFMNTEFTETGSMIDDVIERVLLGFGPKSGSKNKTENTSGFGNSVGSMLSSAIGTFAKIGDGRPLELELQAQIQSAVDIAMGNPRSVELIEVDMEFLRKELEASKKKNELQASKEGEQTSEPGPASRSVNETEDTSNWLCGALVCMG